MITTGSNLNHSNDISPSLLISLMSSLPPLERLDGDSPLASEITIKKRVRLLPSSWHPVFESLVHCVKHLECSDNIDLSAFISALASLSQSSELSTFHQFMMYWLSRRCIIAALRTRQLQGTFSPLDWQQSDFYLGNYPIDLGTHIKHHWHDVDFALSSIVPEFSDLQQRFDHHPKEVFQQWWYHHIWHKITIYQSSEDLFSMSAFGFYLVKWSLASDYRSWDGIKALQCLEKHQATVLDRWQHQKAVK